MDREEPPTQTAGGLFIPEAARDQPQFARVLAVGPGKHTEHGRQPMTVRVGDRVLFPRYGGAEVESEGRTLILLPETELVGIIDGE